MGVDEYHRLVLKLVEEHSTKDKALSKLDIDQDHVREIEPVQFQGYRFEYDEKLIPYTKFTPQRAVASIFERTWLFFGEDQVFVYNYGFDTTDASKYEQTVEYFYADITAFSINSESIQQKKMVPEKGGCGGNITFASRMVTFEYEDFKIVVTGDAFHCSVEKTDEVTQRVSAMKQKLRDKKNA